MIEIPAGRVVFRKPESVKQPDGSFKVNFNFEILGYARMYARVVVEPVSDDLQRYVDAVLPFVYLEDPGNFARVDLSSLEFNE